MDRKTTRRSATLELVVHGRKVKVSINELTLAKISAIGHDPSVPSTAHGTAFLGKIQTFLETTIITAQLNRIEFEDGFTSMSPIIIVGNILPLGSEIFSIVKHGSVNDLERFVASGRGTLWDRDERGTPLLHVSTLILATRYTLKLANVDKHAIGDYVGTQNLAVCKFLIENGADVDEITNLRGVGHTYELFVHPLQPMIHQSS
jgi:hypothetical protein